MVSVCVICDSPICDVWRSNACHMLTEWEVKLVHLVFIYKMCSSILFYFLFVSTIAVSHTPFTIVSIADLTHLVVL